jgi:hypothetical protein
VSLPGPLPGQLGDLPAGPTDLVWPGCFPQGGAVWLPESIGTQGSSLNFGPRGAGSGAVRGGAPPVVDNDRCEIGKSAGEPDDVPGPGRPTLRVRIQRRRSDRSRLVSQPGGYPEASVEVGTEAYEVTATVLEGAERDRVFAEQARRYPAFAEYQAGTERTIPVVALDRR